MQLVKDLKGHLHLRDRNKKLTKVKLLTMLCATLLLSMTFCSMAFAAGVTPPPALDLSPISNAITTNLRSSDIAIIFAAVIAAGITPFLFWFGGRKLLKAAQKAFKSGKISV